MIIIKSTNGDKLRLTPKRLTEIDHTSVDVDEEGDGEELADLAPAIEDTVATAKTVIQTVTAILNVR